MTDSGAAARLVALCFDAHDPMRLARFWADALRWELDAEGGHGVGLVPTDGTGFRLLFLPVPGHVKQEKVGQNRVHLDLRSDSVEDQTETVRRLVELGARHIDIGQSPDESHVVLADPEGNELCVLEPGNSFVARSGRLGSITCDGTAEVGYFWSAALGWPLVWDQDDETAIRSPGGTHPFITWGGPPLMPEIGNRLHLDIAPPDHGDQQTVVDRLVALGATQIRSGEGDADRVVMTDPDGNEFCVVSPHQAR